MFSNYFLLNIFNKKFSDYSAFDGFLLGALVSFCTLMGSVFVISVLRSMIISAPSMAGGGGGGGGGRGPDILKIPSLIKDLLISTIVTIIFLIPVYPSAYAIYLYNENLALRLAFNGYLIYSIIGVYVVVHFVMYPRVEKLIFGPNDNTKLPIGKLFIFRNKKLLFNWKTSNHLRSIVVDSPYQGIYVEGSAGSGKSQSVVEPFICKAVQGGFSGFLYDFKGNPPTLSKTLYGAFLGKKTSIKFAHINLSNPSISHRCNPISPAYIPAKHHAQTCSNVLFKNLNKEWATKRDFWAENTIAYFSGIIWYLKTHHPSLCTIPHAILIALSSPNKSIPFLSQDQEVKNMIGPISIAFEKQADSQLAGVFASLQIPLNKLYTKNIFWMLSSDPKDTHHLDLDINNPLNPTFLSVANDPVLSAIFSPIIALLTTVCMQNMNQQGKHKSVFILDEAPTLYVPGLENLPATARSNNVATMLCVQDFSQLTEMYGDKIAESIRNNLSNQFFGMTGNLSTGEYVSKMGGEYMKKYYSYTESTENESETESKKKEMHIKPHDVATQRPGHFYIKVSGKRPKFFSTQLRSSKFPTMDLPILFEKKQLDNLMEENWKRIHNEVKMLLN